VHPFGRLDRSGFGYTLSDWGVRFSVITMGQHDVHFGIFAASVFGAYYLPALRALQVQLLVIASLFFCGYGQPELLPLLAVAVFGF
jgi:hypothetical protein